MKNLSGMFSEISTVQPKLPGWCAPEKAITLASAVVALCPKTTVEIGVFGGSSFIPMAIAHRHIGLGTVIGIDPWNPFESAKNETSENSEWWSRLDHDAIMNGFLTALSENNLRGVTSIIRKPSDDVQPPDVIDILHIDGSHTEQALRDAQRFASNVRVGGMCFMDDINWAGDGPKRGVEFIQSIGFMKLYDMDTGAMFQRVSKYD